MGGGARYIGSKYANDTNTIELDSALIYNATVGYKKGNWRANLSVQNLTDEEYVDGSLISDTRGTRVYVGTPRTILATIGYKF
ncbi:TonB-dependent receptor [Aliarcobacter butzleri]|nr:TonB-dependent receptor [Aliarcobacter butzleri]MCT7648334.1 TonB-dependent receptor [Aliarcobacter butzleri]